MHLLISEEAQRFMTYNYGELKDLSKQFLTLVSGVLVFSITFTEKIVGYKAVARWPLLSSWIAFILAIVLCGLGLGESAEAASRAVRGAPSDLYLAMQGRATRLTIIGGVLFILGLASLIGAGISTMFAKQNRNS